MLASAPEAAYGPPCAAGSTPLFTPHGVTFLFFSSGWTPSWPEETETAPSARALSASFYFYVVAILQLLMPQFQNFKKFLFLSYARPEGPAAVQPAAVLPSSVSDTSASAWAAAWAATSGGGGTPDGLVWTKEKKSSVRIRTVPLCFLGTGQ